jgi:hypothetical protein
MNFRKWVSGFVRFPINSYQLLHVLEKDPNLTLNALAAKRQDTEFTRCIQPMRGGYTDNYYMQMARNIRRYKGVRPIPVFGTAAARRWYGGLFSRRASPAGCLSFPLPANTPGLQTGRRQGQAERAACAACHFGCGLAVV